MRFALLALAAAALAHAESPDTPPAAGDLRAWKQPAVSEIKLDNGFTIDSIEDNSLPLVNVTLLFSGGIRRDPLDHPGLAASVADGLGLGTPIQPASRIVENLSRAAATMSIDAGPDSIAIQGGATPDALPLLIAVIADLVREANFPRAALELSAQGHRQALLRQASQAGYAANEVLFSALFGDHPYSKVAPSPIGPITDSSVLLAYRNAYLTPANGTLVLAGKLPQRAVLQKLLTERFGSWTGAAPPSELAAKVPVPARHLLLIDRPGLPVSEIRIGKVAPSQADDRYFAALVALELVNSRWQGKFPRGARIELQSLAEASPLIASAQCMLADTGQTLARLADGLDSLATSPLNAAELAAAKTAAN
ncbi:MAG: insulinase family protein, partial [Acidobacteriota bacterium]|nr:insulinase family protein [Acidobacteriota bacterium]